MISSWVQFQRTYHTATLPFYSHFSVLYSFVQMCTDLYILCILPRIISSDGLHDISLCSQKNKKEKKREKGWGATQRNGGRRVSRIGDRERGQRHKVQFGQSGIVVDFFVSAPQQKYTYIYILYFMYTIYFLYTIYYMCTVYYIGSIWYGIYIIYRYI